MGDIRVRFRVAAMVVAVCVVAGGLVVVPAGPARAAEPPSYDEVVIDDEPVSYWRLDDAPQSTVAVDEMGYADATPTDLGFGEPGLVPVGTAARFATSSSLLAAAESSSGPGTLRPLDEVTIEYWNVDNAHGDINLGGGIELGCSFGGDTFDSVSANVELVSGSFGIDYLGDCPSGHVVLTKDSSTLRLYADGVLVGSEALPDEEVVYDDTDVVVDLSGVVDEVAVYDRALSAAEVVAHHGVGAPDDGRSWGARPSSPFAGDPVDVSTGNLFEAKPGLLGSAAGIYGLSGGSSTTPRTRRWVCSGGVGRGVSMRGCWRSSRPMRAMWTTLRSRRCGCGSPTVGPRCSGTIPSRRGSGGRPIRCSPSWPTTTPTSGMC